MNKKVEGNQTPQGGSNTNSLVAIILAALAFLTSAVEHVPKWFRTQQAEQPPASAAIPQAATPVSSIPNLDSPELGCRVTDGLQICWGRVSLGVAGGHVRQFQLNFKHAFATTPVVTTSIDVQSNGFAYAIYNSILDARGYKGSVVEINFRSNTAPVSFSYVAIGPAIK